MTTVVVLIVLGTLLGVVLMQLFKKPNGAPAQAAACQVCATTPGTNVAVLKPMVGTFQLTSPTSVEAAAALGSGRRSARTEAVESRSPAAPSGRLFCSCSAKRFSSAV